MKKVIEFFKSIRTNLKDPKKKSLTLLGIYFVFFVFVYIFINTSNSSAPVVEPEKERPFSDYYLSMNSYKYKFSYTFKDSVKIAEGIYYKNTSLLTYDELKYYYENDSFYLIDNNYYYLSDIEYNISKLFNNKLYEILKASTEKSKISYSDGTNELNYIVDSNVLCNYIFDDTVSYSGFVDLKIIQNSNKSITMKFDFTSLNINLKSIDLEYNDINSIKSLEFNKDNYTYKE